MAPPDGARPPLQFGPFVFDRAAWRLTRDGAPVVLQDKTALLIEALLERPGGLWTRDELYARLWPGVFVTDDSLFQVVRKARAALGDDPRRPRWIETVQGRGYRFLGAPAPLSRSAPPAPPAPPTPAPPAPPAPRPATPSARPLTGRDGLLGRLQSELAVGGGLWTLSGPGGVGKTSLALALLERARELLAGGAAFCDAAELTTAEALAEAVGRAIGLDRGVTDQPEVLAHALDGLGEVLLVVDNLEQMAPEAAPLLSSWRESAPRLRLVVTSRRRLGAREERWVEVPPLGLPEPDCAGLAGLMASDAGELLLAQVARGASRALGDADAPALAGLLTALGGLPLAIELAAPRLRLLSPDQLLARLAAPLDLLRGAAPDRPARHSALRATIAVSWSLLDPPAQAALSQLAQLAGPFPAEAGEAVLDLEDWPDAPLALDMLGELQDHSLIRRREQGPLGLPDLLELLPSIRAFARERASAELARAAQARIAAWYAHPARFTGPADRAAAAARRERANLSAALDHALAAGDAAQAVGLVHNLGLTLRAHGPLAEAASRLRAVLAMPGLEPRARGGVQTALAEVHLAAGELGPVPALLDEARRALEGDLAAVAELALLRAEHTYRAGDLAAAALEVEAALADPATSAPTRARALLLAGTVAEAAGRPREALDRFREALALAEALELGQVRERGLLELGWAWFVLGNLVEARAAWEEARARCAEMGDRLGQARALERLGQALVRQGRLDEAEAQLLEAAGLFQRGGFSLQEGGALDQLARVAMHQGRVELSEQRFRAAVHILERRQLWMAAAVCRANFGTLYARLGRLDEAHAELATALERQRALGGSLSVVLHNLGKVELFQGQLGAARARIQAALDEHEAQGRRVAGAFARASLGQLALAEGEPTEAVSQLSRAVEDLRAGGERGYGLGSALGLLGLAEEKAGDRVAADRAFDEALRTLEGAGIPEALALARVRRGRAAIARGDRASAEAAVARGEADLAAIGLTARGELGWEIAALTAELAQLRASPLLPGR